MANTSLVKVISQKMIKPSSPTPPSSRYHKLSTFDAHMPESSATIVMFFREGSILGGNSSRAQELFEVLENSLSKTLTYYYPFAGRFMNDNTTIDCNDAGVQIWEVQVQGSMFEILNNREEYGPWNSIFHHEMYRCAISHIMIQLSYFECGGVSIIVTFSHRLGDGTTIGNFINDWAIVARGSHNVRPPTPIFSGASIFPPPNNTVVASIHEEKGINLVTQRFVFTSLGISELKRKAIIESNINNPTQNEVVTALIFKTVISAVKKLNSSFKPSSLVQILNFRSLTIPPLSEKMVGNFVDRFSVTVKEENEISFSRIITELRKRKVEYNDAHKACIEGNEFMNKFGKIWIEDDKNLYYNNFDLYIFSSVFRVPFYEADFGFGKPIFVCIPGGMVDKVTMLMGNPNGDGISAFVTLKRDEMSILERDEELLAFASLNPIICTTN